MVVALMPLKPGDDGTRGYLRKYAEGYLAKTLKPHEIEAFIKDVLSMLDAVIYQSLLGTATSPSPSPSPSPFTNQGSVHNNAAPRRSGPSVPVEPGLKDETPSTLPPPPSLAVTSTYARSDVSFCRYYYQRTDANRSAKQYFAKHNRDSLTDEEKKSFIHVFTLHFPSYPAIAPVAANLSFTAEGFSLVPAVTFANFVLDTLVGHPMREIETIIHNAFLLHNQIMRRSLD
ncbi:MAG: hypothetical protein ACR652_06200 [Methylocystis sp.]|uniref:hypothetical protein n=1 Tax=Methylocystis sp. TaxID=1911079 RepID=UPI003DA529CB